MAGSTEVISALDQIQKTNIDTIVISFLITAVVLMLLKTMAEAITGFIQLRLDKHISIGTTVEVYGRVGKVKQMSIFIITIETGDGYIRVPTKLWRASRFVIIKDNQALHNRRIGDKA
jgi:small-conductance mechanosensitive channel